MLSLVLKLESPLAIKSLLRDISAALQETLKLVSSPTIVAEEYVHQARAPLNSEEIRLGSNMIFFEILNEPEIVTVFTYNVEDPILSDDEQGVFVSISPRTMRTQLEVALAASVAVAFGRKLGTAIQDFALFYTPALSQSAESFINAIKVWEPFDDYRVAAQTFYDALPQALRTTMEGPLKT